MAERALPPEPGHVEAPRDRLDSWKDIAAHFDRDVRTVQRWERREAMPVHRHRHDTLGSVYAFRSELDAWRRSRRPIPVGGPPGSARARGIHGRGVASRVASRRYDEPRVMRLLAPLRARAAGDGWTAAVAAVLIVFATGFLGHGLWSVSYGQWASRPSRAAVERSTRSGAPATRDSIADHEYRLGRDYMWRYDEDNLALAIGHFERAIRMDPAHAAALAALSNVWWARGMFGSIDLRDAEAPARQAARRALQLDDRLPAAYVAQGDVERLFDKDPVEAERLFRRALALDADSVEAHHSLALLLMALGRFPEALAHVERAAALDPAAAAVQSNLGRILYRAGRFEEAVRRFERALTLEPQMRVHYHRLGDAYDQLGQYGRALEAYGRAGARGPEHQARVARVFARMGRSRDAYLMLDRIAADESGSPLGSMAAAYTALGATKEAFRLLTRMVERDEPGLPYFPVDPQFVGLHAEPQWHALLQRTGLPIAPHR